MNRTLNATLIAIAAVAIGAALLPAGVALGDSALETGVDEANVYVRAGIDSPPDCDGMMDGDFDWSMMEMMGSHMMDGDFDWDMMDSRR